MNLLVTGCSGNVGRGLLPVLTAEFPVTVYDLVPPPAEAAVRYIHGDILDSASLHWAMQDCDAVVHLAAVPAPGRIPDDRLMEVNVLGTQRVVEAASMGRPTHLIMASSDSVGGMVFSGGRIPPAYVPIDENHPTRPPDAYGLSKLLGEEICRRYTRQSGLVTVCLRYCWVFWQDHYPHVREWQAGDPRTFRPQMWGYIDARDIGRASVAVLKSDLSGHETLVLSARRNFLGRPTLDLVRECYGPEVVVRKPERFQELSDASAFDYSRASELLGWEPIHDWEDEVGHLA